MPTHGTPDDAAARTAVTVIVGPTAAGKTRYALDMAAADSSIEIISADSRQIYLGMDIGTAKPTHAERSAVRHHLVDIVAPDVLFSAGQFAARARAAIADVFARGGRPVVVGGTGFYVKALFEGLGAPSVDIEVLAVLQERGEREGFDVLYRELAAIDPEAAAAFSPNNHVRTLRALCCWHQTGRRFSSFRENAEPGPYAPDYVVFTLPREELYARIDRRVLSMVEGGLVAETRRLLEAGYGRNSPGLRTVGYVEALDFIAGEIDNAEMVRRIQQQTRRYAKRQLTWLRAQVPDSRLWRMGG